MIIIEKKDIYQMRLFLFKINHDGNQNQISDQIWNRILFNIVLDQSHQGLTQIYTPIWNNFYD